MAGYFQNDLLEPVYREASIITPVVSVEQSDGGKSSLRGGGDLF